MVFWGEYFCKLSAGDRDTAEATDGTLVPGGTSFWSDSCRDAFGFLVTYFFMGFGYCSWIGKSIVRLVSGVEVTAGVCVDESFGRWDFKRGSSNRGSSNLRSMSLDHP